MLVILPAPRVQRMWPLKKFKKKKKREADSFSLLSQSDSQNVIVFIFFVGEVMGSAPTYGCLQIEPEIQSQQEHMFMNLLRQKSPCLLSVYSVQFSKQQRHHDR